MNCLQRCNNPPVWIHSKDIDRYYVILVFLPFQVLLVRLAIDIIHIFTCITLHANVVFIIDIGSSSRDIPPFEHTRLVDNSLVGDFTGLL